MCLHRTEHPSSCLCRLWEAWSKCLRAESHFSRLVSDDKLYKFTRNVSECQPAACQLLSFASWDFIFQLVTCLLPHEILWARDFYAFHQVVVGLTLRIAVCIDSVFSSSIYDLKFTSSSREFRIVVGNSGKKLKFLFYWTATPATESLLAGTQKMYLAI